MNRYDFNSLNWHDFELLSRDLLQKELKIRLENFKIGSDGGIDLRYSKPEEENTLIVQAKHYSKSGFSQLYRNLKDSELEKVKKINPKRYILSTSVECSKGQKEKILTLFDGFIQSTNDIYDSNLLNNLINDYPDVERSHYKLWITSTNILETIINKSNFISTVFLKEEIFDEMKIFVKTKSFNEAIKKLNKRKYIIIKGEPGIGKTFLAKAIIYHVLAKGAELIEVLQDDIHGAYRHLDSESKDIRQVFYIDDFLGSNYLDIKSSNYDSEIIKFIKRVTKIKNKFVILTSRTNILNEAKNKISRLRDNQFSSSEYEVNVRHYDYLSRAHILYNHLYYNLEDDCLFDSIRKNKFYRKIIEHRNFNPRLIEYITTPDNLTEIESSQYLEFINDKLENPNLIWETPFRNSEKFLQFFLYTLLSFPNTEISELHFKEAISSRLEFEVSASSFDKPSNYYNLGLKKLLGSFLNRKNVKKYFFSDEEVFISFFNPSIKDFLIKELSGDEAGIISIIASSLFFEQIQELLSNQKHKVTEKIYLALINRLRSIDTLESISENRDINVSGLKLLLDINYEAITFEPSSSIIRMLINRTSFDYNGRDQSPEILYICSKLKTNEELKILIEFQLKKIVCYFINTCNEIGDVEEKCSELLGLFDTDFKSFTSQYSNDPELLETINSYIEYLTKEAIKEYTRGSHSVEEAHDIMRSICSEINDCLYGWDVDIDFNYGVLEEDYTSTIEENLPPDGYDDDIEYDSSNKYSSNSDSYEAHEAKIDSLFSAQ